MNIEEIRKNAPKRLSDKVKLTKDELSKIGLTQLNAYKSKRKFKKEVFIEL
nr:MAG TPA: hypothetical protein [Caudoviricetes sp.]